MINFRIRSWKIRPNICGILNLHNSNNNNIITIETDHSVSTNLVLATSGLNSYRECVLKCIKCAFLVQSISKDSDF